MQISDALATKYPKDERLSPSVESSTLRNAFYITPFVCVIGGGFFLATALFIQKDREKAEKITKGTVTWLEFHGFFFKLLKKKLLVGNLFLWYINLYTFLTFFNCVWRYQEFTYMITIFKICSYHLWSILCDFIKTSNTCKSITK